jgi:hypothetical protein
MRQFVHCPRPKNMVLDIHEPSRYNRSLWRRRAEPNVRRGFRRSHRGSSVGRRKNRVVYDTELILELLMGRSEMTYEEAVEYFDFNIAGSYMGEYTPFYLET